VLQNRIKGHAGIYKTVEYILGDNGALGEAGDYDHQPLTQFAYIPTLFA